MYSRPISIARLNAPGVFILLILFTIKLVTVLDFYGSVWLLTRYEIAIPTSLSTCLSSTACVTLILRIVVYNFLSP